MTYIVRMLDPKTTKEEVVRTKTSFQAKNVVDKFGRKGYWFVGLLHNGKSLTYAELCDHIDKTKAKRYVRQFNGLSRILATYELPKALSPISLIHRNGEEFISIPIHRIGL